MATREFKQSGLLHPAVGAVRLRSPLLRGRSRPCSGRGHPGRVVVEQGARLRRGGVGTFPGDGAVGVEVKWRKCLFGK